MDDADALAQDSGSGVESVGEQLDRAKYLLALVEVPCEEIKETGRQPKEGVGALDERSPAEGSVRIGITAVDICNGSGVFSCFNDDSLRSGT